MILYHDSNQAVPRPDLAHSRGNVDFGKGFYTTPLREQAVKWSQRFSRRGEQAVLSKYRLDDSAFQKLRVLRFETYSEEWLDFIVMCRKEKDTSNYDIVLGGVANDKVFNTVELYLESLIDKTEAIKRLRYEKPNLQLCLRTERALNDYLTFEGSETL